MAENREKLFDQFAPVSTETWKAKVVADLKGADFDKKLVWRTNEGFNVQPMYRAEDIENFKTTDSNPGEYPFIRGTRTDNEWLIRQDIVVEDVKQANEKALNVLSRGANSIGFKIKRDALCIKCVKILLNGIDLEKVEINIESCPRQAVDNLKALVEYVVEEGKADVFKGSVKFDPFVRLLKHGVDADIDIKAVAKQLVEIAAPVKGLKIFTVDSVLLSDAGAYIAQEIGMALAWGNEW
ncbi:MAG: methylmalonyl-CoA mutase family protein, partial [Candidatus Limisoma sp.]